MCSPFEFINVCRATLQATGGKVKVIAAVPPLPSSFTNSRMANVIASFNCSRSAAGPGLGEHMEAYL